MKTEIRVCFVPVNSLRDVAMCEALRMLDANYIRWMTREPIRRPQILARLGFIAA